MGELEKGKTWFKRKMKKKGKKKKKDGAPGNVQMKVSFLVLLLPRNAQFSHVERNKDELPLISSMWTN